LQHQFVDVQGAALDLDHLRDETGLPEFSLRAVAAVLWGQPLLTPALQEGMDRQYPPVLAQLHLLQSSLDFYLG
jgi:hypothetical protein